MIVLSSFFEYSVLGMYNFTSSFTGDAKFIWVGELKTNFLFQAWDKQKNLFI